VPDVRARDWEAELREPIAGTREPAAQTPESTLDSYKRAFPRHDVEALETHLALAAASSFLTRGIEQRIQEHGFDLSRPRYSIVRMLYLSPEQAIAQSEIAQALGVSGSNVTQLIDALVSDRWVERITSSSDKRVTYAALTEAGKERASKLVPAIVDYMVESCSALTADEHNELRRLITKVRETA
jgi:MarR family 2-MHQ and catechol resistance regulon transcriptional repressor